MTDFNFSISDLSSFDFTANNPFARAQNKWNATGKPLASTRSINGLSSSANQSTLSISEILQMGTMFGDPADALTKMEQTFEGLLGKISEVANLGIGGADVLTNGLAALIPDDIKQAIGFATTEANTALAPLFGNKGPTASPGTAELGTQVADNKDKVHFISGSTAETDLRNGKFAYNIVQTLYTLTCTGGSDGKGRFAVWINKGVTDSADTDLHADGRAVDIVQIQDSNTNQTSIVGESNHGPLLALLGQLNTMPWIHQSGQVISPIDPAFGPAFYTNAQHRSLLHIGCTDPGIIPVGNLGDVNATFTVAYPDSTDNAAAGAGGAAGGAAPNQPVSSGGSAGSVGNIPNPQGVTGVDVLNEARKYLNVPYVWGGESPQGFDCSALVQFVFKQLGIAIPRTSYIQVNVGQDLGSDISNAMPGDLLFFNVSGDSGPQPGHVGFYAGNNQMLDAPHTGSVVQIETVWTGAANYVSDIRRIVPAIPTPSGGQKLLPS